MKEKCVFKESGIAWLGKIPKHWEVNRFEKICKNIGKGLRPASFESENGNFVFFKSSMKIYKCDTFDFDIEALIIGDGGEANINYFNGKFSSSDHTRIYISNKTSILKFVYYAIFGNIEHLQNGFGGIGVKNLSKSYLQSFPIPLPPIEEQKAIVDFLDKKCELIEEFIIKKEQLITLLEEKKQALINEVVSKGLDKNAKFKESGIDYLGQIPTHWEVKKLKYIAKVVLGKMLCNEKQENYDYCFYLKSKNLQWLNVEISEVEKMWFSEYEKSIYRIKKGDLLVSEGGEVGKTCIWNNELEECYIQNSVHKIH